MKFEEPPPVEGVPGRRPDYLKDLLYLKENNCRKWVLLLEKPTRYAAASVCTTIRRGVPSGGIEAGEFDVTQRGLKVYVKYDPEFLH
jgi:hypothetical protein